MNEKQPSATPAKGTTPQEAPKAQPGDGIRSLRSTGLFRAVNFELYAKPVRKHQILN